MHEELLRLLYGAFNAGNVDAALALMQPAVEWAKGVDGGYVRGQAGVRELWFRQSKKTDVRYEALRFTSTTDGGAVVDVLEISRDRRTNGATETEMQHVFKLRAGLIDSMSVRDVRVLEPAD